MTKTQDANKAQTKSDEAVWTKIEFRKNGADKEKVERKSIATARTDLLGCHRMVRYFDSVIILKCMLFGSLCIGNFGISILRCPGLASKIRSIYWLKHES